jgi:hypothetical protein
MPSSDSWGASQSNWGGTTAGSVYQSSATPADIKAADDAAYDRIGTPTQDDYGPPGELETEEVELKEKEQGGEKQLGEDKPAWGTGYGYLPHGETKES